MWQEVGHIRWYLLPARGRRRGEDHLLGLYLSTRARTHTHTYIYTHTQGCGQDLMGEGWRDRDEGDDEGDGDEYFEGAVLCEVGEHWVNKEDLLPQFADCYECVTLKEYAEHRGITIENAQRICDGDEGEEEGDDEGEGEDDEASNDEASREEEERMRWIEYDNSFESEPD